MATVPGHIGVGYGGELRRDLIGFCYAKGINFFDATMDSEKEALGRNLVDLNLFAQAADGETPVSHGGYVASDTRVVLRKDTAIDYPCTFGEPMIDARQRRCWLGIFAFSVDQRQLAVKQLELKRPTPQVVRPSG
jgi:hypothetical protein